MRNADGESSESTSPASMEGALAVAFGGGRAAPPGGGVLEVLSQAGMPPSRVLLREASAEAPTPVVSLRPTPEWPAGEGRYQVLGEIARGGIGVVLRGRDVDLGRDVAMKVLRDEHAKDPRLVQRFVEEAQIGGQLQHPGIVPVYELGLRGDRRPFFTMKLVKGRTLAALFAERAEPSADRRRFLTIFEQVCQTVAYAHARGVVHRDLKPSNVMVGAFGEVQVVDWGLAKVLAQGGVADERAAKRLEGPPTIVATVRTGTSGSQSIAGSVMGTPAYMPPEQARGDVEHLDERADVFALGAILCEVLTGKPPYAGDEDDLLRRAAVADLADARARLASCGADTAIVGLAERCLQVSRADRPRDGGAVAAAVAAHLAEAEERVRRSEIASVESRARAAEERVSAEQERAKADRERASAAKARAEADHERARAEQERRARRLTIGLAASAVVCFGLLAGGFAWWRIDQAARAELLGRDIEAALVESSFLRGRAAERADVAAGKDALAAAQRAIDLGAARGAEEGLRRKAADALVDAQADAARARDAEAKIRLAGVLLDRDNDPEAAAIAAREAIALAPANADAHTRLAAALGNQRLIREAEAEYRAAISLDPDNAARHTAFASFLEAQYREPEEVLQQYTVAIRLDPENLGSRQALLWSMMRQGRLDEAERLKDEFRTLYPKANNSRLYGYQIKTCRDALEVVSALLRGDPVPDAWRAKRAALMSACAQVQRFAAMARILEMEGFTNPPGWRGWSSQLASFTLRAGVGGGLDAADSSEADRAHFRALALKLFREDLTHAALANDVELPWVDCASLLDAKRLPGWYTPDELLAKLPPEEHAEWRAFWAEVDDAVAKIKAKQAAVSAEGR